tara:strand:- start:334 stop:561 length:228 start_codon:yes stop_codon:yes gene_type:complete
MEPLPPQGQLVFIIVSLLVLLMAYGIYASFGPGAKDLRDTIDEHSKLHELGIAHGHNKGSYYMKKGENDYPKHKH